MSKSLSTAFAIFGVISVVSGTSYVPARGWPWALYTTTQPPPGLYPTSTTAAPPPPEDLSLSNLTPSPEGSKHDNRKFVIVTDPSSGTVLYIPADLFWAKFGVANKIRRKRSTSFRKNRVFPQPKIYLDEIPQIEDIVDNDEYDEKYYSDYIAPVSPFRSRAGHYESVGEGSSEEHQIREEGKRRNLPQWTAKDVFKAFFPNYKSQPNKMIYTYSSVCADGCLNNRKLPKNTPSTIVETETTTSSPSTTTPSSTTADSREASAEEFTTTYATTDIQSETTTSRPDIPDYQQESIPVPAA